MYPTPRRCPYTLTPSLILLLYFLSTRPFGRLCVGRMFGCGVWISLLIIGPPHVFNVYEDYPTRFVYSLDYQGK